VKGRGRREEKKRVREKVIKNGWLEGMKGAG
jgi:hypothetical protein